MSVNFFSWIREGVRQSVLLGVSDAIEQLGTPAPTEELHPSVAGFLQNRPERTSSPARMVSVDNSTADSSGAQRAPRKRLGKSLKDITPPAGSTRPAPSASSANAT